jgi:hypothetical protein
MQVIQKIIVLFLLLGIAVVCDSQILIGNELKGKFQDDYFGESISLSADGQVVAIGSYRQNGIRAPGYVRVLKLENGSWKQLGSDIDGIRDGERFGYSVALSDDGTRLIASAYNRFEGARVYDFKDGNWFQVGKDISIRNAKDVVISSDWNIIAVGNWNISQPHGAVKVFEWRDGEWAQMGNSIFGAAEKGQSGFSVSLSSDGKTVAIGSINSEGQTRSGYVRVFRFIGDEWVLLGSSIRPNMNGYYFGRVVSISSDGNRVAIGVPKTTTTSEEKDGHVAIFEFIDEEWELLGQEITGHTNEFYFGFNIVLSGNGERVAVTSSNFNCPVRLYDFINGEWKQVGRSITDERKENRTLFSIGMSRNGKMLATGTLGGFPRLVHIYDISEIKIGENLNDDCEIKEEEEEEIEEFKLYPNPTSGSLTVEGVDLEKLRESKKLHLFDILGRSMGGYDVRENTINLSNLPSGTYFLKLDDRIEKIIVAVF